MSITYFMSAQTWGRRQLLQSHRMGTLFVETLQEYRRQGKFLLHDYVVMPDHVHVLVTPCVSIETTAQLIKGGYSFRAGKQFGLKGRIWNHRFDSKVVEDFTAFEAVRKYIRHNPVKARLVSCDAEYLFSSAHELSELDDIPERLKPGVLHGVCYNG